METKKAKKSKASTIIIILLSFVILLLMGVIVLLLSKDKDVVENESEFFSYSSKNEIDPYGLTGENNILGEVIVAALQDYIIRNECDYEINEYFCSFTFDEITYPYGESPKIIIYTDFDTSVVNMVEYSFSIQDVSLFSTRYYNQKIRDYITTYYNVEPSYSCVTDSGITQITREQYENLLTNDYKTIFHTDWITDKVKINLTVFNTQKPSCSIAFTLP